MIYFFTHTFNDGILDNGNMDHEVRSDVLYTNHRNGAWKELEKLGDRYNLVKGQSTPQQFVDMMKKSRVGLSPFGMGELCYRDLELIQWGCLLIKKSAWTFPTSYLDEARRTRCSGGTRLRRPPSAAPSGPVLPCF